MLPDKVLQVTEANLGLLNEQQNLSDGSMSGNMLKALSQLALIHAVQSLGAAGT